MSNTEKKRYYEAAPQDIDVENFRKVVESRRSVRKFTDKPIPEDVLNKEREIIKEGFFLRFDLVVGRDSPIPVKSLIAQIHLVDMGIHFPVLQINTTDVLGTETVASVTTGKPAML